MMRRKNVSLLLSVVAQQQYRSVRVGGGGDGNDNFFGGGRSNFDEMMGKLKKNSSASAASSANTAALPRGLASAAPSSYSPSARRQQQQQQQHKKVSAPSPSSFAVDDDDDAFGAMSFEAMMASAETNANTATATASSSAESKSNAPSSTSTNAGAAGEEEEDHYAREVRHTRQLQAEHKRSDFMRQRHATTGGGGGGGTNASSSSSSSLFGERARKFQSVDYFSAEKVNKNIYGGDIGGSGVGGGTAAHHSDDADAFFASSTIPQPLSQLKREKLTRRSFAEVEDDEDAVMMMRRKHSSSTANDNDDGLFSPYADDDDGTALHPSSSAAAAAAAGQHATTTSPSLEELTSLASDMTLLDDTNFAYFAPASSQKALGAAAAGGAAADGDLSSFVGNTPQSSPKHVPGTPIIPPGFTRYRCDIQYQGGDFDGWDKSTEKLRHLLSDVGGGDSNNANNNGSSSKAGDVANSTSTPLYEVLGMKPRAKKVLEDALSVALDLNNVTVHAAVLPEAGAHVKRLMCHVDVPASIVMQPRTVLQRATVWLEQKARSGGGGGKHMPLAILSFYPCPDQAFDARYSTHKRVYVYRILNRIAPPLFDAGLQWHVDQYLDVERMNRFAALMQGTQDYGCFADPKLGHSLRKSLEYSAGGVGSGGGGGFSSPSTGGGGGYGSGGSNAASNKLSMRFFNNSGNGASDAQRSVTEMIADARMQQRDKTLSKRHMGYVGEDLLAEEAGSSSTVAMRRFVKDTANDGGASILHPQHRHQQRKDEFKQWSPYEEQDKAKIRRALEAKEALYVDYSAVTTRTIDRLQVVRQDDEVLIWFVGKSFLRHQIRNMVAVLKAAGLGLWDERELKHFMAKGFSPQRSEQQKNRFPIAPIHGLTLWDTEPDEARHGDARYRNTDAGRTHELQ